MRSTRTKAKRGPGRPKDIKKISERKEDILKCASKLFAFQGYQNTDVQEIADQLGVAKGTIYHYFSSKEKLFLAAVDRGMEEMSDFINQSVAKIEDPIKKIAKAIHSYLTFFDKHPHLIELIVQERAEFRDRKKPTYILHREKNIKPWNELFQNLSQSGRLRELNSDRTTETISNLLYGTIFTTYYHHQGRSFESRTSEVLMLIFQGILSDHERVNIDEYIHVQVS